MIKFIDKTEFIRYSKKRCVSEAVVHETKDKLNIFREGVVRMKM